MWENENKITIIRNIIIFILLVAAAAGLTVMMSRLNQQIAQEDALLLEQHSSQRQELNEARQDTLAPVEQTYQQHLELVEQYLPGIVCWGDSLTAGSSGNTSYPLALQEHIDTKLCGIYNLSYSVPNPENYSYLNWSDYKISIPVVNMGGGQESAATVLGRSGVVPYVLKKDAVIPAGLEPVTISIESEDGKAVTPLQAGNTEINPVTIAGVEGTLTLTTERNNIIYQFARLEEGQETEAPKGTQIVTSGQDIYRDYIHIVWIGTYGEYKNPQTLVEETKALLQRQTKNTDRYLVIGPCTIKGDWKNVQARTLDAIDSAMMQAFGNRYVNLRKYLIEDGLQDAGMSSSSSDASNAKQGGVPQAFRSKASGADLNAAAYNLVGKLIYDRMEILGYFDEVWNGLNLDRIAGK